MAAAAAAVVVITKIENKKLKNKKRAKDRGKMTTVLLTSPPLNLPLPTLHHPSKKPYMSMNLFLILRMAWT